MNMRATADGKWDLRAINYALGYADGLLAPRLRRNEPTEGRFREAFRRGLSDAERRRPFDPPGAQANDAQRGGE